MGVLWGGCWSLDGGGGGGGAGLFGEGVVVEQHGITTLLIATSFVSKHSIRWANTLYNSIRFRRSNKIWLWESWCERSCSPSSLAWIEMLCADWDSSCYGSGEGNIWNVKKCSDRFSDLRNIFWWWGRGLEIDIVTPPNQNSGNVWGRLTSSCNMIPMYINET